uniref:Uncharacterized protein n=1 Tax=Nelumbo nucifera TaxID=4432 RepID=A0A822YUT2_NELNU|nr:TPA_asm: hypothetical protein HUJ06_005971 [Nelumbo nucifera]
MMDNPIEMCSFRSESFDQTLPLCDWRFCRLLELRSIEQASKDPIISTSSHMLQNELAIVESSPQVNLQSSSSTDSYKLEAIVRKRLATGAKAKPSVIGCSAYEHIG